MIGYEIQFGEPLYLWLLVIVVILLPLLLWRTALWRRDASMLRKRRIIPIVERFARLGPWPFWLCLLVALTLVILAIARPRLPVARLRTAGIDLIVLQDGSASMYVRDVGATRWQRSMQFLETLIEMLDWTDDRMALALFARIAAPQVRLTRDPNTLFFFLDHLRRESPFPLKDETTWDTNIELGIYWGARLLERDEQLNGASANAKAFVLVSDGQAWSGQVEAAMAVTRSREIPVFVVGVGTQTGGFIPDPPPDPFDPQRLPASPPIRSMLDRRALQAIAVAGRGAYFELGHRADAPVASAIVDAVRRRAGSRGVQQAVEDLYSMCLLAAAAFVCLGVCFIRDRNDAMIQAVGAAVVSIAVWTLLS
jgi:Ca-activated chloride channel family protein